MGITDLSLARINRYLQPNSKLLLIGCQNCYWTENYGEIAQDYFRNLGHTVKSIDIYECNNCDVMDLRDDLKFDAEWDMVNNAGTQEHINGSLYQPFKNHHEACKIGGVIVFENPKTGNWPLHGEHYFTKEFYTEFCKACNYEILELGSEPAMGNWESGMNVFCVYKRLPESEFITEEQFNEIYTKHIYAQ